MSLQVLVDMNLSSEWVGELAKHGWAAVHWSAVGAPNAEDSQIMAWAATHGFVVFTHDLDFGTALALTHASGPSILQVRSAAVLPQDIGSLVVAALQQYQAELLAGALVVVEPGKSRVRVLPL